MEETKTNKKFVVKGAGIVLFFAVIIVVIWFIVTRANQDAASKAGNRNDSTSDTGTTNGVTTDSVRH